MYKNVWCIKMKYYLCYDNRVAQNKNKNNERKNERNI